MGLKGGHGPIVALVRGLVKGWNRQRAELGSKKPPPRHMFLKECLECRAVPALAQMVVSYSIGKKNLAEYQPALLDSNGKLERAREFRAGLERAFPFPADWAAHCADDVIAADSNPAQAGIARQIKSEVLTTVRFVQTNAFGVLPEPQHRLVIGDDQGANDEIHFA